MMMMPALHYSNTLKWIFMALDSWHNSPRVDMLFHWHTLSLFRANQSLLLLIKATSLAEKQQIPILLVLVRPHQGPNLRDLFQKLTYIYFPYIRIFRLIKSGFPCNEELC